MNSNFYLAFTIYAVAVWAIVVIARAILSFLHTDRPWKGYEPCVDSVRDGKLHRTRVAAHRCGAGASKALPVFEPLRPVLAAMYHVCWLLTEPVLRIVRKGPFKMSITPQARSERIPFKVRMTRTETPARKGFVVDIGPGLMVLFSYTVLRRVLEHQYHAPEQPLWLAHTTWIVFAVCVTLFAVHLHRETKGDTRIALAGSAG